MIGFRTFLRKATPLQVSRASAFGGFARRDLTDNEELALRKRQQELDARTNQDIMKEIAAIDSTPIN